MTDPCCIVGYPRPKVLPPSAPRTFLMVQPVDRAAATGAGVELFPCVDNVGPFKPTSVRMMMQIPADGVDGSIGEGILTDGNNVIRQLIWAQRIGGVSFLWGAAIAYLLNAAGHGYAATIINSGVVTTLELNWILLGGAGVNIAGILIIEGVP